MIAFALARDDQNAVRTFGVLSMPLGRLAQTLEPGTPIPAGTYPIEVRYSPKRNCAVPGLLDVAGHTDVEVHWGNFPEETTDCILPGASRGRLPNPHRGNEESDAVLLSVATFATIMALLQVANYKALTSQDAVDAFLAANPEAGRATLTITDPVA